MRSFLLVACLAVLSPSIASATQPVTASSRTPAAGIDALIDRVAKAKGVVFIRNGSDYTAAQAAEHLQRKRKAAGKDYYHPNIVFGANAQVALEKFARYFDVEVCSSVLPQ